MIVAARRNARAAYYIGLRTGIRGWICKFFAVFGLCRATLGGPAECITPAAAVAKGHAGGLDRDIVGPAGCAVGCGIIAVV